MRKFWRIGFLALLCLASARPQAHCQELEGPSVPEGLREKVRSIVPRLASSDWDEREEASRALEELGPDAIGAIEEEIRHAGDIEVESRLKRVLASLRFPNLEGLWEGQIDGCPFTMILFRQEGRSGVGANTCHWTSGPLTCSVELGSTDSEGVVFLDEPRDLAGGGRYVCEISADGNQMSGTWTYWRGTQSYLWSLERRSTSVSTEALEDWLTNGQVSTRCSAVHCAVLLPPADAKRLLEKACQDPEPRVVQEATSKLAELQESRE